MFCLVRTRRDGRPQEGITFLLLDMATPGITVEPIVFVSGEHEVNTVFFEQVRVPVANRVGAENGGWRVAKYLLEFERGGRGGGPRLAAGIARLRRLADALGADGDFRRRVDGVEIEAEAVRFLEARILSALSQGQNPGPESSILKTRSGEVSQRITELAVEAVGPWGLVHQPEARVPMGRNVEPVAPEPALTAVPHYFNCRALSIAGGTDEVQRNIVAKLVLGL